MNSVNVFFTADTHFGHDLIRTLIRPEFSSVKDMDEFLIFQWNKTIGKHDVVFHLGDFSFYNAEKSYKIIKKLNGNKCLIKGNHDKGLNVKCRNSFLIVKDIYEVSFADIGISIVLCHFPMLAWNNSHFGTWHLHGHLHNSKVFENLTPKRMELSSALRLMDVGCDGNNYAPLSFEQVKTYIDSVNFTPMEKNR